MADPADILARLLAEERRALSAGDIRTVAALLERKQAALDSLSGSGLSQGRLMSLKDEAGRVQVLLEACLQGMAAAASRIDDLRRVRTGLTTYDVKGQRAEVPSVATRGLERKA